jgi:hypothetical protein
MEADDLLLASTLAAKRLIGQKLTYDGPDGLVICQRPPFANAAAKGKRQPLRIRRDDEVQPPEPSRGCVSSKKKADPEGPAMKVLGEDA